MLRLEGQREFALQRERLWAKLTDLNFLTQCIPDVAKIGEVQEKTATVTIRPGFSFIRGELQLTIEKLEETPPETARMRMKTKGIGSTSEVEATFKLEPNDAGTLLIWTADVKQLGGLLKAVPHGLIQAGAQKVLNDFMAGLQAKLTGQ